MQQFISKELIGKLGLSLSEDELEKLNEDAMVELNQRVIDQVISELDPEQLKELSEMQPDSDELMLWIDKNVPQFDDIVGEETIMFMDDMLRGGEERLRGQ